MSKREREMSDSLKSRTVKVGELNIRYFTGGQGEPLVVIHGGANGASAWLQNAVELSKHYRVYIPDLPGFGDSESMSDDFCLPEFVTFVEEFSNSVGLQRFHLMGHSLGGGIALYYALKFPHRIMRLVLVSSLCLGKEMALWARVLSSSCVFRFLGEAEHAIIKAVIWLVKLFYAPFKFINPFSRSRMGIGRSIMSLNGQTNILLNQLSRLLMPTLLVWGAKDSIIPVSHAYAAARLIPDCQLHVFEGCGHSVYRQKVPEFSQLLKKFLG